MVLCVLLTVVSITEGLITTAEEAFCVPVLKLGDLGAREGSQWVLFEGFEFCDFWYGSRRYAVHLRTISFAARRRTIPIISEGSLCQRRSSERSAIG